MKTNRSERGQALVLIVLAIVAMFGFAALAVDIGRLYAERRRVQSAADAAVLAAAFAATQANDYQAAALGQLNMNDIFDMDTNRNEDVRVDVEIYNPPISGPYGPASGRTEEERNQYYQVIVHSAVDQVFSQFVYQGPLDLTVESVARVNRASGLYAGDVLHATGPEACQGLKFAGNGSTHLVGGNAFSDSTRGGGCGGSGGASCTSGSPGRQRNGRHRGRLVEPGRGMECKRQPDAACGWRRPPVPAAQRDALYQAAGLLEPAQPVLYRGEEPDHPARNLRGRHQSNRDEKRAAPGAGVVLPE